MWISKRMGYEPPAGYLSWEWTISTLAVAPQEGGGQEIMPDKKIRQAPAECIKVKILG